MSRQQLAQRLRHNLATRDIHADFCTGFGDTDLTNLAWLQNMNPISLTPAMPPETPATVAQAPRALPMMQRTFSSPAWASNPGLLAPEQPASPPARPLIQLPPSAPPIPPSPAPEFAVDAGLKPPYSFSTLIYMALSGHCRSKMTMQEICAWISDAFAFYRESVDKSWQSAVRYNLTLNRCFQRVPKRKDEAGNKGGYWRLNPEHATFAESQATASRPLAAPKRNWPPVTASEAAAAKRSRPARPLVQSQLSSPPAPRAIGRSSPGLLLTADWIGADAFEEKVQTRVHDPTLSAVTDAAGGPAGHAGDDNGRSQLPAAEDERWMFEPDHSPDSQPALDMSNPDSLLNLTLQGTALNPPNWWPVGSSGSSLSGLQQWMDDSLDVSELDSLLGAS